MIQTTEGNISLGYTDWQATYNGVQFGVKIRNIVAADYIGAFVCEKKSDWEVVANLDGSMSDASVATLGVDGWITMVVGKLNAWIATRFGPTVQVTAVPQPAADKFGPLLDQCDRALFHCIKFSSGTATTPAPEKKDKKAITIAVVGDSISTRNNGASSDSWPAMLASMIESLGVFNVTVRNYSIPGLTWKTAHVPATGWMIGGDTSPLDAAKRDGCDILLVALGVNDRKNANALIDAQAFAAELPSCRVIYVRQNMFDGNGANDSVVTQSEQAYMDSIYAALGGEGFSLGLGKLYDMGYSYDKLHPTNSGKQWIASGVYMYLQQSLPLTPISRNIAWLYSQTPEVREQMRKANT